MIPNLKCSFKLLLLLWLLFAPWAFYSYFLGENSFTTYLHLRETYEKLKEEEKYWENKNEILKERLTAFEKNKDFYYQKLAREMFLKGKEGEEVILFVK
ncbi:MAG: hypothetical protein ABGX27_09260 [Desulfurobacteriaceae bacterium]